MRLLFVHDHRFLHGPGGAIHTVGSFPRTVWERYLRHFSEVVVVARDGGTVPPESDLARSDRPGIRFALVRSYPLSQRLLGLGGEARTVLARTPGISFIHFDERDVVRHRLVQAVIGAYEAAAEGRLDDVAERPPDNGIKSPRE